MTAWRPRLHQLLDQLGPRGLVLDQDDSGVEGLGLRRLVGRKAVADDHAAARRGETDHFRESPVGIFEVVEGKAELEDQERRWNFVPSGPWHPGTYQLVIDTTIEDLAGNNIGKPFEVDLFENVQRRVTNSTVRLPFDVR